jgi:hypothetical protein
MAGAHILKEHYNKSARVQVGAFCMCTDFPKGYVMTFAEVTPNSIRSSERAFHAWIECDGYIVDLLSPILSEATNNDGKRFTSTPKHSFQKPIKSIVPRPIPMVNKGDFWIHVNDGLTEKLTHMYSVASPIQESLAACSE